MKAKGETKRGQQFLHISDNMPRRSETNNTARRPLMPDAALKKKEGEPKVQVTLCQGDRRDEACAHTYDEEFDDATLATYNGEHVDTIDTLAANKKETAADALDIYDEEPATLANYDAIAAHDEENAAVEGEPWGA
jgi:hypothetical protein